MSTTRVAVAAALLAATAIGGQAEAAWLKSGPGTAAAAALKLSTPDTPTLSNVKCNSSGGGPSATVGWTYPASLPPGFEVLTSLTPNNPTNTTATTNLSVTIPLLSNSKPTYVSVRAVAGAWKGTRSPEVAAC
ncbi:hypothetical protein H4696_001594 [Amycolatopsis lexingtonensis]|uniref:Ig-like domain-containing protein n=1 Tax=Amycolatopsis lexingtonensis TaxID=218822 RepID=A0ABR9HU81_9PSEU|nr:hypothetical protein [Amycolatopsis lexingtonensis]MBE1494494.1 hypothetical protein [Amycolatopsis lexingtonensis]